MSDWRVATLVYYGPPRWSRMGRRDYEHTLYCVGRVVRRCRWDFSGPNATSFEVFWLFDKYFLTLCAGTCAIHSAQKFPKKKKIFWIERVERKSCCILVIPVEFGEKMYRVCNHLRPFWIIIIIIIITIRSSVANCENKAMFIVRRSRFCDSACQSEVWYNILRNVGNVCFLLLLTLKLPTSTSPFRKSGAHEWRNSPTLILK